MIFYIRQVDNERSKSISENIVIADNFEIKAYTYTDENLANKSSPSIYSCAIKINEKESIKFDIENLEYAILIQHISNNIPVLIEIYDQKVLLVGSIDKALEKMDNYSSCVNIKFVKNHIFFLRLQENERMMSEAVEFES